MGDDVLADCASLWREHIFTAASWRAGEALRRRAELLWVDQHIVLGTPAEHRIASFYGMPVEIDPTMPQGTIELRDGAGEVLGRIENVGARPSPLPLLAQQAPRRVAEAPKRIPMSRELWDDGIENPDFARPSTGPTTRLPTTCRKCHDALPPGATFCIECGEKV